MVTNYVGFMIGLIIFLVIVVIAFGLIDRLLNQKPSEPKKNESDAVKPAPAEEKPPISESKPNVMQIYNSELADDLNEMLKHTDNNENARLNLENHIDKESNISKYIHEKNYQSFDFADSDDSTSSDEEQPMTFTREDYKKFMALSNIDDHQ